MGNKADNWMWTAGLCSTQWRWVGLGTGEEQLQLEFLKYTNVYIRTI